MDWLRCNRCYRALFNAVRSFSMTQCGHVYCSPCISQMGEKCSECGTIGFRLMPLTKPPKLEAMINYFAPLEDFMELSSKATNFQDNQMMVAVRGAQRTECEYAALKTEYLKVMNEITELKVQCQKLHDEIKKMQRARESLRHSSGNVPENMEINRHNTQRHYHSQQNRSTQGISTNRFNTPSVLIASGFSAKYRETIHNHNLPQPQPSTSTLSTSLPQPLETPRTEDYNKAPKYPYNPNLAFSNVGYHSAGTTGCCAGSSRSSVIANVGRRVEGFLVPSVQRVLKSAATAKRKTSTGVRLSVPKTDMDF